MGILWIQLFCQWQNIPGKVGCKTIHITGIDIFIKCQENVGIVMLKRTQTVVERFNLSSVLLECLKRFLFHLHFSIFFVNLYRADDSPQRYKEIGAENKGIEIDYLW